MMRAGHLVAGALVRGDRVLLCHRSPDRSSYPDVWDLPGGHVEDGETPVDALVRELREELGVLVCLRSPQAHATLTYGDFDLMIFRVESWAGEIANRDLSEHDDIAWFAASDLTRSDLSLAHPAYPQVLSRLIGTVS